MQDCIICMDHLSSPSSYEAVSSEGGGPGILPETVGKFITCGHALHMLCMLAMYNNGTKVWTQPPFVVCFFRRFDGAWIIDSTVTLGRL